jgi:pimeloyl-ACP methyl ester carboxylesterase
MGKPDPLPSAAVREHTHPRRNRLLACIVAVCLVLYGVTRLSHFPLSLRGWLLPTCHRPSAASPYGRFPLPGDPFHFIPCTSNHVLPALDYQNPEESWAGFFDPNPDHWSWGIPSPNATTYGDPYAGRGIYLCGYIEVPLDYTNKSDARVARLAVTKFQVSGLARADAFDMRSSAGKKSERTIIIEPGGPGGSGTSFLWRAGEEHTERFSDGKFDVLGWDPRGVNMSLPAIACYPYDADRDRWFIKINEYREVSPSPLVQLEFLDAAYESIMHACWEKHGDLGRFMSTAFVARDLEEIRKALDEDDVSGYFVSYGTGIGQTYASMFPDHVGRLILDGTEYVRDHRLLGGFGWTALDNGTNAWHDGFLGECLKAGPEHCALAQPRGSEEVTLASLDARMKALFDQLIQRPIPGYSKRSGPSLITYSSLVGALYRAMYNAHSWAATAKMLYELEAGNSTLAVAYLDTWEYDPTLPCSLNPPSPSSGELEMFVICADSYDAPQPDGLGWWLELWHNMTEKSWIAGNSRFSAVFPCRHFPDYWPKPAEVYRGDLNHTLKNPVLLIAEIYDPATPLRNGRRLLNEMGQNARLIVHHGYGHSSARDPSNCTDSIAKSYILHGTLPSEQETACYANEKPYLYGVKSQGVFEASTGSEESWDPISDWQEQLQELEMMGVRY